MVSIAAPVNEAITVLMEWLADPDTKRRLNEAIDEGITQAEQGFRSDRSFRLPSTDEARRDRFAPTSVGAKQAPEPALTPAPYIGGGAGSRLGVGGVVGPGCRPLFP